jgi:GNAT superfamily N-acetyltransferase
MNVNIRQAEIADIETLTTLFWTQLNAYPAYISHGEIQMGVAADAGTPASDGRKKWENYIKRKITADDSVVYIGEIGSDLAGFTVVDIDNDGCDNFGVICDLLVAPDFRKQSLGNQLFETAKEWLRERGICDIYLESGQNNHAAHTFFEKRGFRLISHIFRLKSE